MLDISLIIPSLNRQNTIINLLDFIATLSLEDCPNEIIIIDQSDKPYELSKNINLSLYNVVHVIESVKSSPRARNIGLSMAKNNIVVFCDDDMILNEKIFSTVKKRFDDNEISFIAGQINQHLRGKRDIYNFFSLSLNILKRHKGHVTKSVIAYCPRIINSQTQTSFGYGGFMAIRKDITINHNIYWDEKLPGHGYPDDLDFSYRYNNHSKLIGMHGIFDPEIKLTHEVSLEHKQTNLIYDFSFIVNRYYISHKLFGTIDSILAVTLHNLIYSTYFLLKDFKKTLRFYYLIYFSFRYLNKIKNGEIKHLYEIYNKNLN
jgi:glycosyltransferase involved in cell wall biosynthesis